MFNPVSTYRIQFHKRFNFNDFERIIPYLDKLGISTIYASPIFKAVPGSMHGYDGVDPLTINSEIGTIEQLRKISKKLQKRGMSWIQDIVPNHMAFHPDNEWLTDFLENGPNSVYKDYFDQSLSDDLFTDKIMVPFLGSELDEVIENGQLVIEKNKDKLVFNYAGSIYPLQKQSYPGAGISLSNVNKDKTLLKKIAAEQYYRLCSWKETTHKISYRRFFTVNSLICINIQNEIVFEHFHRLIDNLLKEGVFQGLRIDHIDGLYDPTLYLQQLRKLAGDEAYIVVEKILEPGEEMPQWPIQGNTGYDFLADVNNLFTNNESEAIFTAFYHDLTKNQTKVKNQISEKKRLILTTQMAGELDNLTHLFLASGFLNNEVPKTVSPEDVKKVLAEFLVRCPVYRYYGNEFPLDKREREAIEKILKGIVKAEPGLADAANLLGDVFFKENNAKALRFYQKCMQFTGPLMAKGVEDTLMYTYNRFIAHNEVGDAPEAFGLVVADYHKQMAARQKNWPLSMNGTSTHDTKRGEDARARLNVLTDLADEWIANVNEWRYINKALVKDNAPDVNDEYFIYETLAGNYPMPGEPLDEFDTRLTQYLEKTLREAKQHSDWAEPDEAYEGAVKQFAKKLLDKKGAFWKSFSMFHKKISDFGIVNSLAQVLLKFICPGMPDTYQGCEIWDLSMVDPDNRRPVDYQLRKQLLTGSPDDLWRHRYSGQIKLWLTNKLLEERKSNPLLFLEGTYLPLKTEGAYKDRVIAFARHYKNTWYIIAAPLNIAGLCDSPLQMDWKDTAISLPENAPDSFENVLVKTRAKAKENIPVQSLFTEIPVALLKLQHTDGGRGSGVLLHITSLPSEFGIGDFGPAAKNFANVLHKSYQKYWQLLPLSPVDEKNQFSPYSAWSGMGGNILLISPELLQEDGLLTGQDLEKYRQPAKDHVDFKNVDKIKNTLFTKAWSNYKKGGMEWLSEQFNEFLAKETTWLDDFALFSVFKEKQGGKPWYQWPDQFKLKEKKALREFRAAHSNEIEKAKWLQFMFTRQWQQLKGYCNSLGISLFGDLPFYVGYDSVDAWAHPEIFSLDKNLDIEFVAGVPPDYFNANGQLWGMPVFNWKKLKESNYNWWVQRIKKNMELFDLLRLDHFRAFSAYWAVPAKEKTAINGEWLTGPDEELFAALKEKLSKLPFVAEDLGEIDAPVYQLRDKFKLPGMKVLQFAFGDDMPQSPHIPHNYTPAHIVYTGTHDNNTATGWFRQDADHSTRNNLSRYAGVKVNHKNVSAVMSKLALSSVAKTVIIPVQDLLGLDESARMNVPAATEHNWQWRLTVEDLDDFPAKRLKKWTVRYNRD